jgi:hypothetical protein
VNRKDEELARETEVLRRNVLAEIGRRFIPIETDRQHFILTGETTVWDKSLGR